MEQKGFWLLSIILIVKLSSLTEGAELASSCQCQVDPEMRENCGQPEITAEECVAQGCCFSSAVAGAPWCFVPKPKQYKTLCGPELSSRLNCGYPDISAEDCENRGCCFDPAPPDAPWCFYPQNVEEVC